MNTIVPVIIIVRKTVVVHPIYVPKINGVHNPKVIIKTLMIITPTHANHTQVVISYSQERPMQKLRKKVNV